MRGIQRSFLEMRLGNCIPSMICTGQLVQTTQPLVPRLFLLANCTIATDRQQDNRRYTDRPTATTTFTTSNTSSKEQQTLLARGARCFGSPRSRPHTNAAGISGGWPPSSHNWCDKATSQLPTVLQSATLAYGRFWTD
jgi:hypothetical protein